MQRIERTATILLDPQAISIPDEEHSEDEEHWVTMGLDTSGGLVIAGHTSEMLDAAHRRIRLISARKAPKKETRQYVKVER